MLIVSQTMSGVHERMRCISCGVQSQFHFTSCTWISGHATRKPGYLLNSMCDLTQFVVSSITFETKATVLTRLFVMEDVVLSFDMVAVVVVVDADSRFRRFNIIR